MSVIYPNPAGEGSLEVWRGWGVDRGDPDVIARNLIDANKKKKWTTAKRVDLKEAITGIKIDDTIHGSSTLTISFHDPKWELIDSGFFDVNENGKLDKIDIEYPDHSKLWWRVTQIGINATRSGATIDMTLMERVAAKLVNKKGPKKRKRGATTRAEFIKMLTQEINPKPKFYCKELSKSQEEAGGDILYVGDSLGEGTLPHVRKEFPNRDITGAPKQNMTSAQVLAVLKDKLTDKHRVIVFDAGTNDFNAATLRSNLDAAWNLVKPRRMVVASINRPDDTSDENREINEFAEAHDNVLIVPWGTLGESHLSGDGIHPTAAGYKNRGNLFAGAISGQEASPSPSVSLRAPAPVIPGGGPGGGLPYPTQETRAGRTPGISRDAVLYGKTGRITGERLKRAEEMLDEAEQLQAPAEARIALMIAGIIEAPDFANPTSGGTGGAYGGVLQYHKANFGYENAMNPTWVTNHFLTKGATGAGGAIKFAKAGLSAPEIINKIHNPGGQQFYTGADLRDKAKKIIRAYGGYAGGGDGGDGGDTDSGGGHYETQPFNFEVKRNESYWSAITRLATDVKWAVFVDGESVFYEKETVLIRQVPAMILRRPHPAVVSFSANWDVRKIATEATLELVCSPFEFRAGDVIQLDGWGPASSGSTVGLPGRWLVEEISRDRYSVSSTITLKQPQKPGPEPAADREFEQDEGTDRDAAGDTTQVGNLTYPLAGTHGTKGGGPEDHGSRAFGNWESDNAVDIMCPRGTTVVAVADGTIQSPLTGSWNGGSGNPDGFNVTLVASGNRWFYTHLMKRTVRAGEKVKAGDKLGDSGAGNGVDHLHIGCEKGNPVTLLKV